MVKAIARVRADVGSADDGSDVAFVRVIEEGVPIAPPANSSAPVPLSSVTADRRFALDIVASAVATPVPKPETPVEIGNPVAFVSVPEAGVPRTGAVIMGAVSVLFVSVWVPVRVTSPMPEPFDAI